MTERSIFWQLASANPASDPWNRARATPPFDITGLTNDVEIRLDDGNTVFLRTPSGSPAPGAPGTFTEPQWDLLGNGDIRLNALPADATAVQYRVNTGSGFGAWASLGGIVLGTRYATTAETGDTLQIRAMNGATEGVESDTKTVGNQLIWLPETGLVDLNLRFGTDDILFDGSGAEPVAELQVQATSTRTLWSIDSIDGVSLTAIQNAQAVMRMEPENTLNLAMGIGFRGAYPSGTETVRVAQFGAFGGGSAREVRNILYNAGVFNLMGSTAVLYTAGVQRYLRGEVDGNASRVKSWVVGAPEPGPWTHEGSDVSVTSAGWLGIFNFNSVNGKVKIYGLGVGINGARAPLP